MDLFENLQLMKESKCMTLTLDTRYISKDEVEENIITGKENYNVDLNYNIGGQFNDVTVSGSPENVKNWINNVYGDWNEVVGSQEQADEYNDCYWYEIKEMYFNCYPNATEDDFQKYVSDVGKSIAMNDLKNESQILKNEKDIEQVVESTELRPFTSRDHMTWGGEHNFADGSEPMIVDGEFATILVGQSDEQVGTEEACISIYYGDPEGSTSHWGFRCYDNKESAMKDARILAKLADEEIDENQLKRFGFEIVG